MCFTGEFCFFIFGFQIVCVALVGAVSALQFRTPGYPNYNYHVPQHLGHSAESQAQVVRSNADVRGDGTYSYGFETSNGIAAQESGLGGHSASGSSSYTAPDGTPIQLTYTADENGFQPIGAHLPTAPPTPEHVLRALAWIQAHPSPESQGFPIVRKPQPYYG